MADRKQTPDILAEILGGESGAPPATTAVEPEVAPKPKAKRRSTARKTSPRTRSKSQQWEYMEIVFRDYGGYRPRYINSVEQVGWKNAPLIHDYLNQLGEEGWELAGIGSRDDLQMPAYFKRPK